MSAFIRSLAALKVKEVPDFLKKTVTVKNVTNYLETSFAEYRTKYILPGSPMPIYHVMGGVFVTAYITVWPTEYRHMIAAGGPLTRRWAAGGVGEAPVAGRERDGRGDIFSPATERGRYARGAHRMGSSSLVCKNTRALDAS